MEKTPVNATSRKLFGRYLRSLIPLFLIFGFALATCSEQRSTVEPTVVPTSTPEPAPALQVESVAEPAFTAAPTSEPTPGTGGQPDQNELVVCLGQEPESLYLYSSDTLSAVQRAVLEAIYDGPIDRRSFSYQPVILEKLPTLADGDALMQAVEVSIGDVVVDDSGRLVTLDVGMSVQPSGCSSSDCAVVYDGQTPLTMDEMVVTFKLLPGLTWSDGTPLTVRDSIFSFQIAAQSATPGSKNLINRTAGYEALDETTVQWIGQPGFKDPTYFDNFWSPLPSHVLEGFLAADLLNAEESARSPLGWGPYILEDWIQGDHMTLRKNSNYFRASDGLPAFDSLVFRFVGDDPDAAVAQLLAGDCDILDQVGGLDGRRVLLADLEDVGLVQAGFQPTAAWEHLDFGINPAGFDDGWVPGVDSPDYFGDPQTRQAFALCTDRQTIVDTLLPEGAVLMGSFLPPDHPAFNPQTLPLAYDPQEGSAMLEDAGWFDSDGDGVREYAGAGDRIPSGTRLELDMLYPDEGSLRREAAVILARSMQACGIQVTPVALDPDVFYRTGPSSQVFGRQFELALWSTPLSGSCRDFLASSIPGPGNVWLGTNIAGYSGPDMELVCAQTAGFLPNTVNEVDDNLLLAQQIFSSELPLIPVYQRMKTAATRPGLCQFSMDATAPNLWNIESLFYGDCTEN